MSTSKSLFPELSTTHSPNHGKFCESNLSYISDVLCTSTVATTTLFHTAHGVVMLPTPFVTKIGIYGMYMLRQY